MSSQNSSGGDANTVMLKRVVTRAWNTQTLQNTLKPKNGGFRIISGLGDHLSRQSYSSGGPNAVSSRANLHGLRLRGMPVQSDGSNIAAASANVRYVPDSSDYTQYRKQKMTSKMGFPEK